MNVEDQLSDMTADLVGLKENSLFLERLFSIESGQWVDVVSLCSGLSKVRRRFEKSRELSEVALRAT